MRRDTAPEPARQRRSSIRNFRRKLEAIINKALEKDRNLRYQHAADMRTDLQRLKRDSESGHSSAASSGTVAATSCLRLGLRSSGRLRFPSCWWPWSWRACFTIARISKASA